MHINILKIEAIIFLFISIYDYWNNDKFFILWGVLGIITLFHALECIIKDNK